MLLESGLGCRLDDMFAVMQEQHADNFRMLQVSRTKQ